MNDEKIKVLFIAGSGRSGSTILHDILGQIDGFFAGGEIRYIWERGFIKNKLCGCGIPFHECGIWRTIMCEAFGGKDHVDAEELYRLTESFRIHHLPSTLIPPVRDGHLRRLSEYTESLAKLYAAIQSTTESRVIVDSSKNPSYGYVLRMLPVIDLYVLHFVRDSRAVAYSWSKEKLFQPGDDNPDYMARKKPVQSGLQWNARNLAAEIWLRQTRGRYKMLHYDDFVDQPRRSIEAISDLLGETPASLPFVTEHTVELKPNHSVFGNLVRFQTGTVELRLDDRWQTRMSGKHKRAVTVLTWPLLLKYGYLCPRTRATKG